MIKMNRLIKLFLIFLLCFFVPFISCTEEIMEPISVTSVTLNSTSMELVEGTTQTLIATVSPSNADNQKVIWSSSNSSVATVANGVVTAIKAGTATITVKTDEGAKTATCNVTVVAKEIPVISISLDQTKIELTEGDELTLTATVKPDNATNKNVSWTSSNESVASVTNGVVTAIKSGTAIITVKTDDGGKTATCNVTVVAKEIPVTSISLDQTKIELTEGDKFTLTATVKPDDATNKNVSWSSSDPSVATVSNGVVTAIKAGTAAIIVKTDEGAKSATCSVTVVAKEIPVTSISLDQTVVELTEGDEFTLTAIVKPDNATNKNVSWSSTDPSVATVSDGVVTAIKAGTATITVTTEDGGKIATCEVVVNKKIISVESIRLNYDKISMMVGEVITIEVVIKPSDATNKTISWSSSNPEIATVDNGKVIAHKLGTATISVSAEDGNITASCIVSVVNIESMVQAKFTGIQFGSSGNMTFEGAYIKITGGVTFNVALDNYSNQSITLTGFRLICGKTNLSIKYTINETEVLGNKRISYNIKNPGTLYSPIVEFLYSYKSEDYIARVQYNGSF